MKRRLRLCQTYKVDYSVNICRSENLNLTRHYQDTDQIFSMCNTIIYYALDAFLRLVSMLRQNRSQFHVPMAKLLLGS